MKTLTRKIVDIGTVRRKRVETRAAALIAEEISHDLTGLDLERENLPKRVLHRGEREMAAKNRRILIKLNGDTLILSAV